MATRSKNTRSRSKKLNNQQKIIYLGISIFLLSLFLILFMLIPKTGIIGRYVNNFLKGVFGFMGRVLPFMLLYFSFCFLFPSMRKNRRKYIVPTLFIFFALIILFDVIQIKYNDFGDHFNQALKLSNDFKGGGWIGVILSHPVRKIAGDFGAYLLSTILVFVAIFLSFSVQKKDVIDGTDVIAEKIENKIKRSVNNVKDRARIVKDPGKALELKNNFNDDIVFNEEEPSVSKNIDKILNIDGENTAVQDLDLDVNDGSEEKKIPIYTKTIKTKGQDPIDQFSVLPEDETKEENAYVFPPLELLSLPQGKAAINKDIIARKSKIIEDTLASFGIEVSVESINRGPTITCYELKPATGVKISRIVNLQDDLAMALESKDIRIVAPIPGKNRVGIETPNDVKETLFLREILETDEFINSKDELPLVLGKDITGKTIVSSISDMPHLLIAGATGSGKSVCINSIILSIIYHSTPEEVKFILIDPKVVELSVYNNIPHLLIPVVTDSRKASVALDWAVTEMERRYGLFAKMGARDFKGYNAKAKESEDAEVLKKIVIIIDELADLMMVSGKEVEESIARLAQMARAAGMHLIVATQRPSVDVITGTIKANIPSRISFAVSSQIDSRTILDMAGAEKLLGRGDMLFLPGSASSPMRIQGTFVSDKEIENIIDFIKVNNDSQKYDKDVVDEVHNAPDPSESDFFDELFEDAVILVVKDNQGSISYLQRKLRIGYSRAARIIDRMEELGIVGPSEGSKPRKVLISLDQIDEVLNGKESKDDDK